MKNEELYMKEIGSFIMGFEEAKDLFRGSKDAKDTYHGILSITDSKEGHVLELEDLDRKYSSTTQFFKGAEITFCSKSAALHVASELGFKPTDTTEVTAWLVGKKSVMVKVFDTNTRPKPTIESSYISTIITMMGYELGYRYRYYKFYLHKGDVFIQEGEELNGSLKEDFAPLLYKPDNWKVVVKELNDKKIICQCTHIGEYQFEDLYITPETAFNDCKKKSNEKVEMKQFNKIFKCQHKFANGQRTVNIDNGDGTITCVICGETFKEIHDPTCEEAQEICDKFNTLIQIAQVNLGFEISAQDAKMLFDLSMLTKELPWLYKKGQERLNIKYNNK